MEIQTPVSDKPFGKISFFAAVQKLKDTNRPFAVATVIEVRGSASAKPGSKALIDESGKNVWGWVGGGCAETFVAKNALEAMLDGQTRIVEADLDDEIFGLGMPCGGVMDVYIEPQKPVEKIAIEESNELSELALHLASWLGFEPNFISKDQSIEGTPLERSLFAIARAVALSRGTTFLSLKRVGGGMREIFPWPNEPFSELLIVGSSRITEALAQIGSALKWKVRVYGWNLDRANYPANVTLDESIAGFGNFKVEKDSAVIVASHHKGDPKFIAQAIEMKANYVGMVASPKRAGLVFEHLTVLGTKPNDLGKIYAPAGLEMNCNGPQEIALSVLAEIIQLKAVCARLNR